MWILSLLSSNSTLKVPTSMLGSETRSMTETGLPPSSRVTSVELPTASIAPVGMSNPSGLSCLIFLVVLWGDKSLDPLRCHKVRSELQLFRVVGGV